MPRKKKNKKTDESKATQLKNRLPFRKNVLLLMSLAYGVLFAIFIVLVCCGTESKEAYNIVSGPFVALIGGTLALAKDLI